MKSVDEILAAISDLSAAERRELVEKLSARGEFTGVSVLSEPRQPALAFSADQLEGQPDYVLVFDGGSMGNPGSGYGNYALIGPDDEKRRVVRLEFAGDVTSNEAEYDTLIAGLTDLVQTLTESNQRPSEFSLEVKGDSSLAIKQISGVWKARDERMRTRRNQVRELLGRFAAHRLVLQSRQESVRILGH